MFSQLCQPAWRSGQSVELGIERSRVRNSLVPSGTLPQAIKLIGAAWWPSSLGMLIGPSPHHCSPIRRAPVHSTVKTNTWCLLRCGNCSTGSIRLYCLGVLQAQKAKESVKERPQLRTSLNMPLETQPLDGSSTRAKTRRYATRLTVDWDTIEITTSTHVYTTSLGTCRAR